MGIITKRTAWTDEEKSKGFYKSMISIIKK